MHSRITAPNTGALQTLGDAGRFQFLKTVLGNSHRAILLADSAEKISYLSPSCEHLLGPLYEQLVDQPLAMIFPDLGPIATIHKNSPDDDSDSTRTETACQRSDGSRFVADLVFTELGAESGGLFSVQVTELDPEKVMLQRLKDSEAKYRLLIESAPVCIHEISLEGQLMSMNTAGLTMIESAPEAICGIPYLNFVDEGSRERVGDLLKKAIAGESSQFEFAVDGPEGKLQFSSCFVPIRSKNGEVVRLMGITEDITARLAVEAQRLKSEQQMLHAQKLESLGVLSGGIAHDFNNLLMVILGNASLAREETQDETIQTYLQAIDVTAARAAGLCEQLLAYTGKGNIEIRATHLSQLIEGMQQILSISVAKNVVLRQELNADLPSVDVDRTQIGQIIMNLVINGSDAIGAEDGVVTITTGVIEVSDSDRESLLVNRAVKAGQYVYLEVSDTGTGITTAAKERMFDPFYSTKETGRGLGLAATMGIVNAHAGAINCISEIDQGTTIRILLPTCDKAAESLDVKKVSEEPWRGKGLILVVDDEKQVQEVTTRMLQQMGFNVITADHGLQALEIFETRQQDIDLVLLDMVMPHLDGKETLQRLRESGATTPVLLTSGYNEYESTALLADQGQVRFIQKPYALNTLRERVRAIIETTANL